MILDCLLHVRLKAAEPHVDGDAWPGHDSSNSCHPLTISGYHVRDVLLSIAEHELLDALEKIRYETHGLTRYHAIYKLRALAKNMDQVFV